MQTGIWLLSQYSKAAMIEIIANVTYKKAKNNILMTHIIYIIGYNNNI